MKKILRILFVAVIALILFCLLGFFWLRHDKNYEKLYGYAMVNVYETQKTPLTIHQKVILFRAYIDTRNPSNLRKALGLVEEFDDVTLLVWQERTYLANALGKIARADDNLEMELKAYEHFLPQDKDKPVRGLFEANAYLKRNDREKAHEVLADIKPLVKDNPRFLLLINTMLEAVESGKTTAQGFNELFLRNLKVAETLPRNE